MEIKTIQPFLQYFANVRERTMRVARCIPPDKVDWSYAPGKFTLGDLLRHIAVTERYLFAENILGRTSRYTQHGKELAGGRDDILALLERLHGESMEIFSKLSDADLLEKCRNAGGLEIAKWKCFGRWWSTKFITAARFIYISEFSACPLPHSMASRPRKRSRSHA
jgi:hypothetical protein